MRDRAWRLDAARCAGSLPVLLFMALTGLAPCALAQVPGGQPGIPAGKSLPPYGSQSVDPVNGALPPPPPGSPGPSPLRSGMQLGPPGRWWDDPGFVGRIGLDKSQQHRMDDIFKANRGELARLFKALQHEEEQLAKVTRAKKLDEAEIDAQIDRMMAARGALEKANVHLLLQIRGEMTPAQTEKLEEFRPPMGPGEN
jgi:Spy/CpxP family protein refolding chaperone